jgi:short-subunit dehydrogenase
MQVSGEIAVVTGASSGIGAAAAELLAKKGARVVMLARRPGALDDVAGRIRNTSGREAKYYPVDLSQPHAAADVARRIKAEIGAPAILVNCAGMGVWRFIEETTPEQNEAMMAVPYFAAFNMTRALIPGMLAANRGHIVNVNSPAARFTWPGACAYTAARAALWGFTEALRSDLYRTKIRVTHAVIGHTESDYWKHNPGSEERMPKIGVMIPPITPDKAAKAIVRGIERNKAEVVTPLMMKLIFLQHAIAPWLVEWLMRETGYRRKD